MQRCRPRGLFDPCWLLLGVCLWAVFPRPGFGGGGPENVLLVVNRSSPASLTVANHYVALRDVPAGNVLTLPWNRRLHTTDVDTFREKILTPVLRAIDRRRLTRQIDYVVYSTDLPWAIDLTRDVRKFAAALQAAAADDPKLSAENAQWPKHLTRVGSTNGLTYLWEAVRAANPAYLQMDSNRYMRLPVGERRDAPSLGFSSTQEFGPRGQPVGCGGRRYMLSMMLGVTAGRGNTLEEVLHYLRRSAAADGTRPGGTIYYMKNKNVRSKARHHAFPAAVEQLGQLGVQAEIIEGTLPRNKPDVQGAMIGAAEFDWRSSGSTIRPGAICEHFTSYGGALHSSSGQAPLSEFLRYGAAGASGTVTEPYSVPHKFPTAMIHVHYARGCTLAEAFYQSVYAPYQLLIVGDPLCRPWANVPRVEVEGVEPDSTVKGRLMLKPAATVAEGPGVDRFELFIDGWRRTECLPGRSLAWDTANLADGHHELRVVAVEAGPIRSRGRRIIPIYTANHGRTITVTTEPRGTLPAGRPVVVAASSAESKEIVVLHHSRLVGRIDGPKGQLTIAPGTLGYGPVRLRVFGVGKGGPLSNVIAKPVTLRVEGSP